MMSRGEYAGKRRVKEWRENVPCWNSLCRRLFKPCRERAGRAASCCMIGPAAADMVVDSVLDDGSDVLMKGDNSE